MTRTLIDVPARIPSRLPASKVVGDTGTGTDPGNASSGHTTGDTLRAVTFSLLLAGGLLTTSRIVQAVAAAAMVPVVVYELLRRFPVLPSAVSPLVVLFGTLGLAGLAAPPTTPYGKEKFSGLMVFTLFTCLAALTINTRRRAHIFLRTWIVLGCAIAVTVLFGGTDIHGRAIGLGANPIGLGRMMASALVALSWMALYEKSRRLPLLLLGGPLLVWAAFETQSKGPLLAGLAGMFVTAVVKRRLRTVGILWSVVVVGFLYAVTASTPLRDSRLGSFLMNPLAVSDPRRADALARSWPVVAENPWGVGYGNWSAAANDSIVSWPHDLWIELAAKTGWLAFGVVLVVVLLAVTRLWRAAQTEPLAAAVLGLLATEAVTASFSGDLRARTFFGFLFLAFVVVDAVSPSRKRCRLLR